VAVSNSTLSQNDELGDVGGGIFNGAGGTMTVSHTTLYQNGAEYAGGIDNSGALTVTNSTSEYDAPGRLAGYAAGNSGHNVANRKQYCSRLRYPRRRQGVQSLPPARAHATR
jgi:hypothetical protein